MIFTYHFTVDHVHDGDTIYGDLDMGLGLHLHYVGVRFYGINCPELSTADGKACRDYLETIVYSTQALVVDSYSWDKYSMRIDGIPYTVNEQGFRDVNLCQMMLKNGPGTKPYP